MLKFLRGNAKILNASVPIGVASDNLTVFSPVRSPRNRHGAEITETILLEKPHDDKVLFSGKFTH